MDSVEERAAFTEKDLFWQDPEIAFSNYYRASQYVDKIANDKRTGGLTKNDLFEIHRLTMQGLISESRVGVFRDRRVGMSKSGVTPPNPVRVPEYMDKYLEGLNGHIQRCKHSVKYIPQIVRTLAYAWYVLSRIHPFEDGNGREARLICNFITKKFDIKPLTVIKPEHRELREQRSDFLSVLRAVDKSKNLAHLELFIARRLVDSYMGDGIRDRSIRRELTNVIETKQRSIVDQVSGGLFLDMHEVVDSLAAV